MGEIDPDETGGGALVVGFLSVPIELYRNPVNGLDAARVRSQSRLYLLVVPLVGLGAL